MKCKTIITYSKNEYQRIGNMVLNLGGMAFWCYQRYRYILMLLIVITSITSCGAPSVIKKHIKSDDVLGLIDDYKTQKPKYQRTIIDYIFTKHNFQKDSYATLTDFRFKSLDEYLMLKFDNIVKLREDSILSILDSYDNIKNIATYYKTHDDEHTFLMPIVIGVLTQNITEYEYKDVRAIYREFKDTDIKDSIFPYYNIKREEALPQAVSTVEAYCVSEMKIFEAYRKAGRERIPQVSSKAFEKMIDEVLDFDIPKSQKQLLDIYNKTTSRNNPIVEIKEVVKDETGKMMKDMNECRGDLVKELLDVSSTKKYNLSKIPISVKKIPIKCPVNDFKAISDIQNRPEKRNKTGIILSLASWIPGFIGTAATVADLYKGYKDAEKKAAEISPYMKKMAKSVYTNFLQTCNREYDTSLDIVKKSVLKSQENLKHAIYEDF